MTGKLPEDALARLLAPGEKVKINTDVAFTHPDHSAHTWNNAIVIKYFLLRLDLPSYYDAVRDGNLTGLDLLSLHDQLPHPLLASIAHPLHKVKILSHVKRLRDAVVGQAKSKRPEVLAEWDPAHVASWLHIEQGDELAAAVAFRGHWTGANLREIVTHKGGAKGWTSLSTSQQTSLLTAIDVLVDQHKHDESGVIEGQTAGETELKKGGEKKKSSKKKTKTALQKRRKQQQQQPSSSAPTAPETSASATVSEDEKEAYDSDAPPPAYEVVAEADFAEKKTSKVVINTSLNTTLEIPSTSGAYHFDRHSKSTFPAVPTRDEDLPAVPSSGHKKTQNKKSRLARAKQAASELNLDEDTTPLENTGTVQSLQDLQRRLRQAQEEEEEDMFEEDYQASHVQKPKSSKQQQQQLLPQQQQQHATQPLMPPSQLLEREAFLQQIQRLQRTVTEHATVVSALQQETRRLQREKDAALRTQLQLQLQQVQGSEVLQRLVRDRDLATQELEKLVQLFQRVSTHQENDLGRQVLQLQSDLQRTKNDAQRLHLSSTTSSEHPLESSLRAHMYPTDASAAASTTKAAGDEDDDLEAEIDRVLRQNTSQPPSNQPPKQLSSEANSPNKPIAGSGSSVNAQRSFAPRGGDAAVSGSGDLLEQLLRTTRQDLTAWRRCLRHYRLPHAALVGQARDTRQLLVQVASRWTLLGSQALYDLSAAEPASREHQSCLQQAHKCAIKFLQHSHFAHHPRSLSHHQHSAAGHSRPTSTSAGSQVGATVRLSLYTSAADETASPSQPTLRHSQRQADHYRNLDCAFEEEAVATALVFVFACLQRLLHRFHHLPSNHDHMGSDKDVPQEITGSSSDWAELSGLLNHLRQGDLPRATQSAQKSSPDPQTPQKPIPSKGSSADVQARPGPAGGSTAMMMTVSRDNLRDFLDQQLGLDLPWDKFDAIAQRVDRDQSGFVSCAEVFNAFLQLHPSHNAFHAFHSSNHSAPNSNASHTSSTAGSPSKSISTASAASSYWPLLPLLVLSLCVEDALRHCPTSHDAPHGSATPATSSTSSSDLGAYWLTLLTQPSTQSRSSSKHFARYLQHLQSEHARQAQRLAEHLLEEPSRAKPSSAQQQAQALVHDQALVAGLLLESGARGVDRLGRLCARLPELKKRHFQHLRTPPHHTSFPAAALLGTSSSSTSTPAVAPEHLLGSALHYLVRHREEVLLPVAHTLAIYGDDPLVLRPSSYRRPMSGGARGSLLEGAAQGAAQDSAQGDVLQQLSRVVVGVLQLRRQSLRLLVRILRSEVEEVNTEMQTSSKKQPTRSTAELRHCEQVLDACRVFAQQNPTLSLDEAVFEGALETSKGEDEEEKEMRRCAQEVSRMLGMPLLALCTESGGGGVSLPELEPPSLAPPLPLHSAASSTKAPSSTPATGSSAGTDGTDLLTTPTHQRLARLLPRLPRLHRLQLLVECSLLQAHLLEDDSRHHSLGTVGSRQTLTTSASAGTVAGAKGEPGHVSTALLDLQRTLHQELWPHEPMPSSTNSDHQGPPPPRKPPAQVMMPHVIGEVDEVLSRQRVEHVTRFLTSLNTRAAHKKRLLSTLLTLWQATKLALQQRQAGQGTQTHLTSDRDRALAMPVSEIVAQTRHIQGELLRDMQTTATTQMTLLEGKVELIRRGLESGAIVETPSSGAKDKAGDGEVLAQALLEVDSLKASLLQANNDAMRLSARILQQLAPSATSAHANSVANTAASSSVRFTG